MEADKRVAEDYFLLYTSVVVGKRVLRECLSHIVGPVLVGIRDSRLNSNFDHAQAMITFFGLQVPPPTPNRNVLSAVKLQGPKLPGLQNSIHH